MITEKERRAHHEKVIKQLEKNLEYATRLEGVAENLLTALVDAEGRLGDTESYRQVRREAWEVGL